MPVHLYLINLLFAGLIVALTVMFTLITSAVFDLVSSTHPRSRHLCRVYFWLFATGVVTRLWSLAAFSLSTLAIVISSKKAINKWIAAVTVLTLWLVPMLLSLYIMLPYAFEVQFEQWVFSSWHLCDLWKKLGICDDMHACGEGNNCAQTPGPMIYCRVLASWLSYWPGPGQILSLISTISSP